MIRLALTAALLALPAAAQQAALPPTMTLPTELVERMARHLAATEPVMLLGELNRVAASQATPPPKPAEAPRAAQPPAGVAP